jgi:hypothetical protein
MQQRGGSRIGLSHLVQLMRHAGYAGGACFPPRIGGGSRSLKRCAFLEESRSTLTRQPECLLGRERRLRQVVADIRLAQGRSQSRAVRGVREGAAALPLTAAIATWSRHRRSQAVAAPLRRWNPPVTQSTMRRP